MAIHHVFIIPDGNRRWAMANNVPIETGYLRGVEKMLDVAAWCKEFSVGTLSLWGFSTENFDRSAKEKEFLFSIFEHKADELLSSKKYDEYGVRIRFLGELSKFPESLNSKFRQLEEFTKNKSQYALNIFMGYGGRQELVHAVQALAVDVKSGSFSADDIDEQKIESKLYTHGLPDPDLIIRTSGEKRLSGALPWQSIYSELYFSEACWPDFSKKDFQAAIDDFYSRQRRFGR